MQVDQAAADQSLGDVNLLSPVFDRRLQRGGQTMSGLKSGAAWARAGGVRGR